MVKYTIEDCINILEQCDTKTARELLKHIFSFTENINLFGHICFPHAITTSTPEFHKELYDMLFDSEDGAVAAPRGHGKSTTTGLVFISYCIVHKLEKYIVYVSQNHAKTVQFLEPLRREFKTNEMLKFLYGDLTPLKTKDDSGRDREDCIDINEIRIEAVSFEKNLRGFKYGVHRPTLIIGDDIESDDRVINPLLRLKDSDKLNKIIIPALDIERGRFKMIGTILHHDSLLLKKIHLYNGRIYKAIWIDKDGNEQILMPELFTKQKLDAKRKSIGSVAFQSEYLNEPVDNESSLIKAEWVRACFDETLSYWEEGQKYDYHYQGVDFAFSDRVSADKSAFIGLGVRDGYYTLTSLFTNKGLTITQQFDYIQMLTEMHGFDDNALEENSIRSMSDDLNQYNFPYTLFWTGGSDGPMDKLENMGHNKRHTVGKKSMILRLAAQFENCNIRIPYKTEKDKILSQQLLDECTTYALEDGKLIEVGIHGDIPMALCMALERANMDSFSFGFVYND